MSVYIQEGQRVLDIVNGENATMSKAQKRAVETASLNQTEGSPADISTADGAKVLNNLDKLAKDYNNLTTKNRKSFLNDVAEALGAKKHGSNSQYATFETKNGQTITIRLANVFTVLTEMNNRSDEVFADFYSNRKASSTARQTHSEEAQADIDNALSAAKVGINSELSSNKKDNSVREHRVYHGTGADFDAFHNAKVSTFDNHGEDNGISIVVSHRANQGVTNDGQAHVVEYYYPETGLRRADGKPLADIVRAIKQSLYSGEFYDTTGLAERTEVNAEQIRLHEVKFFRTADGEAYGFVKDGKIYLDPRIAGAQTAVHEYTHLWAEALRQSEPEKWKEIADVLQNDKSVAPLIEQVKKNYPELSGDDLIDELLAHYSGKRGAERLNAAADKIEKQNGGVFGKAEAISAIESTMPDIFSLFRRKTAVTLYGIRQLNLRTGNEGQAHYYARKNYG